MAGLLRRPVGADGLGAVHEPPCESSAFDPKRLVNGLESARARRDAHRIDVTRLRACSAASVLQPVPYLRSGSESTRRSFLRVLCVLCVGSAPKASDTVT